MKVFEDSKFGEAVQYVRMHAEQSFSYSDLSKELVELNRQYDCVLKHRWTPGSKEPIKYRTSMSMN